MKKYRHKEWSRLVGAPVEIRRNGTLIRSGIVDDAMPASSLLWLAADPSHDRALFSADDNYEVWIEQRLLDGDNRYRMADAHVRPNFTLEG